MLADGPDHRLALAHAQRERLFAIHILAGHGGGHGDQGVPVVGYDDRHRVDVLPGEQLAKVVVRIAALVPAGTVLLCVERVDLLLAGFRPRN